MAVKCSGCGEELLGAVNRCWRCGRQIEAPQVPEVPPVIVPEMVLHAPAEQTSDPQRTGSPFARHKPGTWRHWQHTVGRDITPAILSTWAALVLSVYGWVLLSVSSITSFVLATVSFVLAIVGLWSRHRPAAVLAIFLSGLLIGIAGYHVVVELFIWNYGYHPLIEPEYPSRPPGQVP